MQLQVLYEDNHLLIINKPAGTLVQGDITGDRSLIDEGKQYIKIKYQKPGDVFLGLTHRLDRPVSGCVIFARTSKALSRINEQFRTHTVEKHYLALTSNKPEVEQQELVNYLVKDEKKNRSRVVKPSAPGAKKSNLSFDLIGYNKPYYLFHIRPGTGRSHQIRVQLSHIGCPIAGDLKYGYPNPLPDQSIALHCFQLKIVHPTKKEDLIVSAPLPDIPIWQPFRGLISKAFDSYQ